MSNKIISLYRARLAGEKGTVRKDWGGKISVALVYPNHYHIGMSNLGFQIVYDLFNRKEKVVAERVFFPEDQEMSLYLESEKPLLSLESQTPLEKFDLVAFSLSFENDYPNILKILQLGKIPLRSEERGHLHPIIMGGGVTTFLNPEPLADFFDLFLLGEAETSLDPFITLFAELSRTSESRQEILRTLAQNTDYVYVPSLYHVEYCSDGTIQAMEPRDTGIPQKVKVAHDDHINDSVAVSTILTPETEFSDRILVELGRGCGHSCRFCAAGYVYRPPRIRDESRLLSCLNTLMEKHKRLGLLSACVSDIPGIERMTGLIADKGGHFSISSLRADTLTEKMLEDLKRVGQRSVAIAPEAGSERLRRVVNKHLTRNQISNAIRLIGQKGKFSVRLYFLIGLPTESREDVTEIVKLVKHIKHHLIKESKSRGEIGQIKLSLNCFIPKPFTPFQWFPMEDISTLKEKQKWLKKALGKEGGIRVSFDVPKWAYLQTLLSMGDRRVGSLLLLSHQLNGNWTRAYRSSELNSDFFVYRPKALDEILPWDFMDHGIFKEHLIKEYRLALKEQESEVCQVGTCDRCGVCSPQSAMNGAPLTP
ncbi:MAG: TIGR03960 family B12-binding radical SAM protein [Deltaproteobacteria bacterium]|nr:TIGR03960 family B12-binding radical SAM protein [Deltaproteobacteria bacterium]